MASDTTVYLHSVHRASIKDIVRVLRLQERPFFIVGRSLVSQLLSRYLYMVPFYNPPSFIYFTQSEKQHDYEYQCSNYSLDERGVS